MGKSRALNLGTGSFVLLGFAALFFLTTQTTSRGLSFASQPHYDVTAKFDNIGDLKVGAPVSIAGVEVGRVAKISFDSREFKAVVVMSLNSRYNQIPADSDASIYTQGLLGGKYVGLAPGGADTYLKDKDHIDVTFSAFVLENLIGQLAANFIKGKSDAPTPAAAAADAPEPTPGPGPEELVQTSARRMLTELDANRPIYAKDPAKLDALVANVLLPNFDSEYAARLVLGQIWRTATPEQRKRFVDAFYHSLLRNYGEALLDFTADRLVILPYKGDPGDTAATVRTEVKKSSGEKVPVNFTLRRTDTGWKAWDVVISGVSYVKSFRTDIGTEVQQKGLDEVIQRLETEEAGGGKGAPGKSVTG